MRLSRTTFLFLLAVMGTACGLSGKAADDKLLLDVPWETSDGPVHVVPGTRFILFYKDACVKGRPIVLEPFFETETPPGTLWSDFCTNDVQAERILAAEMDDPEVFAIEALDERGVITIVAKAAGSTVLRTRVRNDQGDEQEANLFLNSAPGNEVAFYPSSCAGVPGMPGAGPFGFPVGSEVSFRYATFQVVKERRQQVWGPRDYQPFTRDGLTLTRAELTGYKQDGLLYYQVPSAPGELDVSSPLDPRLAMKLVFFEATSIASMNLVAGRILTVGEERDAAVSFKAHHPSARICLDDLPRRLVIQTPAVCYFGSPTAPTQELLSQGPEFRVRGQPGTTCRIRAELQGTTLAAEGELSL